MNPIEMPVFMPWEGSEYRCAGLGGVRLLILGESQYGGDPAIAEPIRGGSYPDDRLSTTKLVEDLAIKGPSGGRPFWTKVTKLVLGKSRSAALSPSDRRELWSRVAFYNYIQWWMPAARYRPTETMWREAQSPFLHAIDKLAPHLILVLGVELGRHLPTVATVMIPIRHPSSVGFSYPVCQPRLSAAIGAARSSLNSACASSPT